MKTKKRIEQALDNTSEKFSRSIKVRLYPNKAQTHICDNSFGIDRFVFNRALALKKSRWENHRENLSWIEISKMFTLMKKSEEYSFLNIGSRSVIEQSLQKLDRAYQNFFKLGMGFPKFKKKSISEDSFVLSDPSRIVGDKHMVLPKLGTIKIKGLRKFDGTIRNVTVKRNKAGEYFATFSIEDVEKKQKIKDENQIKKTVGIDVNLENYLTDSNGNRIENPRFKKFYLDRIKFYQRRLAKLYRKNPDKKANPNWKQSRKYREYKLKLARLFEKISNLKQDFLHKLSSSYVKNHDIIKVENLQIANMIRNHKLAEAIASVSWGEFFRQLEYKSKWHGVVLERVDANFTSKTCNVCGEINDNLLLSDRTWVCSSCKTEHVRDENAAKNIRNKTKSTGRGTVRKIGREIGALAQLNDSNKTIA